MTTVLTVHAETEDSAKTTTVVISANVKLASLGTSVKRVRQHSNTTGKVNVFNLNSTLMFT